MYDVKQTRKQERNQGKAERCVEGNIRKGDIMAAGWEGTGFRSSTARRRTGVCILIAFDLFRNVAPEHGQRERICLARSVAAAMAVDGRWVSFAFDSNGSLGDPRSSYGCKHSVVPVLFTARTFLSSYLLGLEFVCVREHTCSLHLQLGHQHSTAWLLKYGWEDVSGLASCLLTTGIRLGVSILSARSAHVIGSSRGAVLRMA